MGALLRFKRETGREITEMTGSLEDLCTYLWCCVVSCCKRDGVEFGMSLMDFADSMDPTTLSSWANKLSASSDSVPDDSSSEKKTSL